MAEKENSKEKFLQELNIAIDNMDTDRIDLCLNALSDMDKDPIHPEKPQLFARRIRTISRKENVDMKPRKYLKIAVVAALISLMCLTAYAAGTHNFFKFIQNGKFITLRTTDQSLSENQAKKITSGPRLTPEEAISQGAVEPITENFTFDSKEQAEEQMDMALVVPQKTNEMNLDTATGMNIESGYGLQTKIVWLNYSDESGRILGVTTSVHIISPDIGSTSYTEHDIDEGSLGSYISKSGIEFTLLTESDDSGERTAHIATAFLGSYEYSLVFLNFDEAERQSILDSMDLSAYE